MYVQCELNFQGTAHSDVLDCQSNPNPITIHLIEENLNMSNIKLIFFVETLVILGDPHCYQTMVSKFLRK
jgi:hypothetical protein